MCQCAGFVFKDRVFSFVVDNNQSCRCHISVCRGLFVSVSTDKRLFILFPFCAHKTCVWRVFTDAQERRHVAGTFQVQRLH